MKYPNLLLLFFLCLTSTLQAGGPWTQPKGKGYFKLSEWWLVFDQHFTDTGLRDPNVTTGIFTTALYAEFGITDRLTTVAYAPLLTRNYMNNLVSITTGDVIVPGEAVNRLGDIDISFKYRLSKAGSKVPIALSVLLGLPTGTPVAGELNNLQTGDGEFNQMIQLDAGKSFKVTDKIAGYASAYLGFNRRSNGFSEEIRYGIESGLGFGNQRVWLIGRLFGVESLKNGATAADITSTSIFANNAEFTSYSLEAAVYATKNVGFSASFASAFRGEIIAAAPSYSIGIFYDMNR